MKKLILALVSTVALFASTAPASASNLEAEVETLPVIVAERGSDEAREVLTDLAGTQSRDLIQAAINSDRPIEMLMAPNSVTPVAVVELAEGAVAPLAITPITPGCGSTSSPNVCLHRQAAAWPTTKTYYGFSGTGTLTGSWTNTVYAYPGGLTTVFGTSAGSVVLRSGVSATWAYPGVHVTGITR